MLCGVKFNPPIINHARGRFTVTPCNLNKSLRVRFLVLQITEGGVMAATVAPLSKVPGGRMSRRPDAKNPPRLPATGGKVRPCYRRGSIT